MKLKFSQLDNGSYSVKVCGNYSAMNLTLTVPDIHLDAPVTEIKFRTTPDGNLLGLHIPASVERVVFPGVVSNIFAAEVSVDGQSPYFSSDGKALYSKDGKILYRLFPRYIEEYTVTAGTEILAERAFDGHLNLKSVTLPDGLKKIESLCFSKCEGIEELHIPDSVVEIGKTPFIDMHSLRSLHLPDKIKTLGFMLLRSLKLEELYIPASVEHISEYMTFDHMDRIDKYTVSPENPFFRSENGVIYSKDMTVLVRAPRVVPSVFDVPESVRKIADNAFNGCTKLSEIVLHEGLEYIGTWAFIACPLSDVTVPKSVIKIGGNAFEQVRSITVYDTLKPDSVFRFPAFVGNSFEEELIVRNAETGEIKHRIRLAFNSDEMQDILCGCFDENWNFDYDRFDRSLTQIKNPIKMTLCAAYRLKNPPKPVPEAQRRFTDILRKNGAEMIMNQIEARDFEDFALLAEFVLTEDNITGIIDYAAEKKAVEFTAFLLDFRNKHFGTLPDDLILK